MTGVSAAVAIEQDTCIGSDVWALPVAGAIVYPLLVKVFILTVQAYQANGVAASRVGLAVGALALMSPELAVPLVALRALIAIRNSLALNAPLVRRVLHLVSATPPALTLSGFVADGLGVSPA